MESFDYVKLFYIFGLVAGQVSGWLILGAVFLLSHVLTRTTLEMSVFMLTCVILWKEVSVFLCCFYPFLNKLANTNRTLTEPLP